MSLIDFIKKQKELKENAVILEEKAKIHTEIQKEKEYLARETHKKRLAGTFSKEDQEILEKRKQRIEEQEKISHDKMENAKKNLISTSNKVILASGKVIKFFNPPVHRKKRSRY